LLQVATVLRRITDALVVAHDFPELAAVAERVLPDVLPIESLQLFALTADEGLLRFSDDDSFVGTHCDEVEVAGTDVSFDIPGDGPPAQIVIRLTHPVDLTAELMGMFVRLAPPLRTALNRHLGQRQSEQQHDKLRESAIHDALTGLYNRHALDTLARIDQQYGVLMIDIDHFKSVNDRFGHASGDEVLRRVSTSIVGDVRPQDVTIRYGGEEIIVLLASSDRSHTAAVAERIRARVGALQFPSLPDLHTVTISIGAAIHHRGQPVDEAIADADRCLYRAKNDGRNRVCTAWQHAGVA
jgi:diguanylate cyclase (GGDEF)-like protein